MGGPVLIVEDDPDIRESVRQLLELEGYETATAENGQEALALLARIERPCVILLDLMMPVISGWQLLEVLKRDATLADIPVVITSAVASSQIPPGATRVLRKPIPVPLLLSVVRECT
jgi:CheY-like chemotaxis protein